MTIGPLHALGTTWWVECFDTHAPSVEELEKVVQTFLQQFEAKYSRFLPNSYISRLNQGERLQRPSTELVELLRDGQAFYTETQGHFNIITGHVQEAKGYDSDYSFTDTGVIAIPGNPTTQLTVTEEEVSLSHGKLDLGGYGKGWCIDALCSHLQSDYHLEQLLINGGGDIFVTHIQEKPLELYLQDPHDASQAVGKVQLQHQALAVSNPHLRSWTSTKTGENVSHIPSHRNEYKAAYVIGDKAAVADAYATTSLLVTKEAFATFAPKDLSVGYLTEQGLLPSPSFRNLLVV